MVKINLNFKIKFQIKFKITIKYNKYNLNNYIKSKMLKSFKINNKIK
jgi:hypothetical protein